MGRLGDPGGEDQGLASSVGRVTDRPDAWAVALNVATPFVVIVVFPSISAQNHWQIYLVPQ